MKIFSRLNKMAFLAFAGLVIGGCGFFGNLFGVVDSATGKFGEGQSVCNNISKGDIFGYSYSSKFKGMGELAGGLSAEQVEKILNVQINYIDIKRDEKDDICGFVVTADSPHSKIMLTSQEIGQLERALAGSNKYHYYETNKNAKENYYAALKFLKYIKRWNIPNNRNGLESLENLGQKVSSLSGQTRISIKRFLFGKEQQSYGYNFKARLDANMSLGELRNFFNDFYVRNLSCDSPTTQTECSNHLNEIRAIKNYAESLLK